MTKKSFKIDMSTLANSSPSLISSMMRELEGKDSADDLAKASSRRRWGLRFAASGLKKAQARR